MSKNFQRITLDVAAEEWRKFAYKAGSLNTSRQQMIRDFIHSVLAEATPEELARPDGVAAQCPVCGRESLDETEIGSVCAALLEGGDGPCVGTLEASTS